MYFDISSDLLLKILSRILIIGKIKLVRLDFRMMDIRDENSEVIRLRLPREDLFGILSEIKGSKKYQELRQDIWETSRFEDFLNKSISNAAINHKFSAGRIAYLIHVVAWHMKQSRYDDCVLFAQKRIFQSTYSKYAKSFQIVLKTYCSFSFRQILWNEREKNSRWITFLKYLLCLKPFLGFREKSYNYSPKMTLIGRGDRVFTNNGLHSDVFFWFNSSIPGADILFPLQKPLSELEKRDFSQARLDCVQLHISRKKTGLPLYLGTYRNKCSTLPRIKNRTGHKSKIEKQFVNNQIDIYNGIKKYWYQYCQLLNIKILLSWDRFSPMHMAIADGIKEAGGVMAIWQLAYNGGVPAVTSNISSDILFSFSNQDDDIEKKQGSKIPFKVAIGYPKDYLFTLLKDQADLLRKKLISNGVKKIIACFDENSLDDSRWHTGHDLQRENYFFLLEMVLSNPWIGVIFKPKVAKTLQRRLGPVAELLNKAKATGRCLVLENSGIATTLEPPVLAALASDIAIQGHLSAGTSAMESALAGIPTLLVDREGQYKNKLYALEEGKVVFRNWRSLMDALMEFLRVPENVPGFGDWSPILDQLDPFRDGRAAERMGSYLDDMLRGFKKGLRREDVLANVAEKYGKVWGYDKISEIR